ncbi:MAG TPA: tetratricopeptide repeat protein [Azospira sp.]|nr:tetratricopeptide repeat protein [Azospira sp.]
MATHFSPAPRLPRLSSRSRLLPALLLGALIGLGTANISLAAEPAISDIQKMVKQGQNSQALEKVDAYIATRPKDPQGRFLRGIILTELNRPSEAIAVFTKLTEDFPELPEPYNNLAVLYAQQKQYEKARGALEMAIRTHPSYAVAHENLGDVYAKLASQAYDKALQLDSNNTHAQTKLSMIKELIGNPRSSSKAPSSTPAAAPTPAPAPAPAAAPTPAPVPTPAPAAKTPEPAKVTVLDNKEKPVPAAEPAKAEKPAPAKGGDADEGAVTKAVQSWAAAWSRKDVKGYLSFYGADFQVPGGGSRKAWENERASRIDKPGKLQVTVDDIKVSLNGDKATVRFKQNYTSATLKSSAGKTLVMQRSGGKWLIQQEKVGS